MRHVSDGTSRAPEFNGHQKSQEAAAAKFQKVLARKAACAVNLISGGSQNVLRQFLVFGDKVGN